MQFKPQKSFDTAYILTFANGEAQDIVVAVERVPFEKARERGMSQAGERVKFEYPGGHGSALEIGRVEAETEDSISFTTKNPPDPQFEGVVTFTQAGRYDWSTSTVITETAHA